MTGFGSFPIRGPIANQRVVCDGESRGTRRFYCAGRNPCDRVAEGEGLLLEALKMAAPYSIVFSPPTRRPIGVAELVVARSALPSAAPSRCAPLPCLPP